MFPGCDRGGPGSVRCNLAQCAGFETPRASEDEVRVVFFVPCFVSELGLLTIIFWRQGSRPVGFPCGPWNDPDEAKDEIGRFCMDSETAGGGWAICWVGVDCPTKARRIGCGNRHSPAVEGVGERARQRNGTYCKWQVRLKVEDGRWILGKGTWVHNHTLFGVNLGLSARAGLRAGIPADFLILGRQLRNAGMSAGRINDVLCSNAGVETRAITWNLGDVRQAFMPSYEDRCVQDAGCCSYIVSHVVDILCFVCNFQC
jgi:hypothetical protein